MSATAKKADPELWENVKRDVTAGDKGGKPGQWSARKAQLASAEYQKAGGEYVGRKSADNHLQAWTDEEWGTRSGKPSEDTGERCLPKDARDHLSKADYERSSEKKRRDTRKGKQFSAQPGDIAEKTAKYRGDGQSTGERTKAELYQAAKARDLPGRSTMTKAELATALAT